MNHTGEEEKQYTFKHQTKQNKNPTGTIAYPRNLTHTHSHTLSRSAAIMKTTTHHQHEEQKDIVNVTVQKSKKYLKIYSYYLQLKYIYSDYRHSVCWFFFIIRIYIHMYSLNCLKYYKYKYVSGHVRTICTAN